MLRVDKVCYELKGRKLLKDISFQLRKGEVLAILGANGAGKSTLMSILCGCHKPTCGTIFLNDKPIQNFDPNSLSKTRALLCQQHQIAVNYSVREIVMMGRYPHFKNNPSSFDLQIVEEIMELCGVLSFADRDYLTLSGGEQQRAHLARVLAQIWDCPNGLLLLDEPISALDLHYQQKTLAIIKALAFKGFMVVFVVHDINFAATYADRIIMLKNGKKLFDGTPIEVLNKNEIYTIFSVQSNVVINPKTLKPTVNFEEMIVEL